MNKNIQLISKNFHNTNITKIFETSKLFQTFFKLFLKYFLYLCFKNFDITNITKFSVISKFFSNFFQRKPSFWYDGENLVQRPHQAVANILFIFFAEVPALYQFELLSFTDRHSSPLSILAIKSKPDRPISYLLITCGSEGSRTLVFNPFLIISTSCALLSEQDLNLRPSD